MQLWHSPFFDGGVENCPSSVGLYRVFNPLALWALPLYSLQEHRGRGLKVTLRSAFVGFLFSLLELFLLLRNSPQCCGTRQGEEGCQSPPLCFAKQNIGEVSRSDGGVERLFICSFFSAARRTNQEAPPQLSGY